MTSSPTIQSGASVNETQDHLYVDWSTYHGLIERLAAQIHDSGWRFDAILCLARGGLRIGDALSRMFERPLGVLFTSSYREEAGTRQSLLQIGEHVACAQPLPGSRLLLADDLVDSGATLAQLLPQMARRWPQFEEVRTAVLWQKGVSKVRPDYVVEHLPHSPWIHQPFEIYDEGRYRS